MEYDDYLDPTEISGIEEMNKFIENNIETGYKKDKSADSRGCENETTSEETKFLICQASEEMVSKFCNPDDVLNIPSKMAASRKEESIPWCSNSRNIDEVLLQSYISKYHLKDDFLDIPKEKLKRIKSQETAEKNFGDIQNFSNSSSESRQPKIDFEQKDLERLSPQKQNTMHSVSKDCLVMDSRPLLGNLVTNLKDLLLKVDELLEAMDSRPHWNRLVAKSNSPWKLNIPQLDNIDSGILTDRKPKILKEWTETRLKYSRLSTTLNAFLHPSRTQSQMMELLADLKNKVLECFNSNVEQESLNLPENIVSVSDLNSDARFLYNVDRRLLTIEVTLTNIKFEIEKLYEELEKENIPNN